MVLLYIASLPHSGSTLLDLLVGKHPRMIGLGGIDRAMRLLAEYPTETSARICSCGVPVAACPYWGEIMMSMDARSRPTDFVGRYALALEVFSQVFGPAAIPVDSSKIKEPLAQLRDPRLQSLEARVLHLTKDFRTAAVSYTDNKRRKAGKTRPGWLLTSEGAWKWWRENLKLERAIQASGWPVLGIGYETLCMAPAQTLAGIAAFVGLPPGSPVGTTTDTNLRQTGSHLFIGNRMRKGEVSSTLRYDNRWMSRTDWLPAAVLMPWLHPANRRWVHTSTLSTDLK